MVVMPRNHIHLAHLGCAKNLVDSEIFLGHFLRLGFSNTEDPQQADLIVVNTCGFINSAKEQSIDTILEHVEEGKRVIVSGCLYQRYAEVEQRIPEVVGWLKSNQWDEVRSLVERLGFQTAKLSSSFSPWERVALEKSPYAYLRISQGCNKSCTFCSIPGFKGPLVSRSIESLIQETQSLIDRGAREINLVSQDTVAYGLDFKGGKAGGEPLKELIQELSKLNLDRIRLLYLYPLWLKPNFYEFMAESEKVCNYIDMPLQHANPEILSRKKRPGNGERYLKELNTLRKIFPEVATRSTFIAGFPTETEACFKELKDFVRDARFDWMGAFTYSTEDGTPAAKLHPKVHPKTRERRQRELVRCYEKTRENLADRTGKQLRVILEDKLGDQFIGRSEFQAPEVDGLTYVSEYHGKIGDNIEVKIVEESGFDDLAIPVIQNQAI